MATQKKRTAAQQAAGRMLYGDIAKQYTYRVFWSEEDGEFVGVCTEFGPKLSHLDETQEAALAGIVELVRHVLEDMSANNEEAPVPISKRRFSGRFQVRIPPEQHRELAREAAEAGISLNRLAASRLRN